MSAVVAVGERARRRRGRRRRIVAAIQRGDVNSAIATVRQKKISARPACAVEIGAGQEEQHRQAAEHALRDHGAERRDAEPLHPAPRLGDPQPGREDDREEADRAGDQPMAVLVEDAADPLGWREREHVPAVAGRPVRERTAPSRCS